MTTIDTLNEIFRQVFDDPGIVIKRETTADDIDEWDSLSHINLVIAVESKFNIKFALGELQTLKNVGDMVDLIEKKIRK
jgi:acyl carrier protein